MMRVTLYNKAYDVTLRVTSYQCNDNLAIVLMCDEGPFATMTVNLDEKLANDFAFVDTNNCPWAIDFIEEYELGHDTGITKQSGYCRYPLYKFNMKKLSEYDPTVESEDEE